VALAWFATLSALVVLALSWKFPLDPDLFWHLRAGGDILAQGIPRVDWYSHTFANFPWVDHEYAQEVFMIWLHRLGGFRLLSIVYAVIVTLAVLLGIKWSLPKRISWFGSLLAGLAFAALAQSFLGARPQMFTYAFILLALGIARRLVERPKSRLIWLLPPLFAVWANWHGSFIAGLIIIFILVSAKALFLLVPGRFEVGPRWSLGDVVRLFVVFALCVAATFFNPYGTGVWVEAIRTLGDRALHQNIVEWFAPHLYSRHGPAFFVVSGLLFVTLLVRQKRLSLVEAGWLFAFWGAGLSAVRNIPLFYLVALPLLAAAAEELIPKVFERGIRQWLALGLATLGSAALVAWRVPLVDLWQFDNRPDLAEQSKYPVGASAYLAEHQDMRGLNMFNEYGWGGYLLWRVPYAKTFIDGRMPSWELEGVRIIDDYFKADRAEDGWPEIFTTYQVGLVVVRPQHRLVAKLGLDQRFEEVFRDDLAVIFAKKDR
jgi:hypothetical protein